MLNLPMLNPSMPNLQTVHRTRRQRSRVWTRNGWRAFVLAGLLLGFPLIAPAETGPVLLDSAQLQAGAEPLVLRSSGCNRALSIHVTGARVHDRLNGRAPPAGFRWLTLDTTIENWMPLDLVFDLGYQEAILIASLQRQLYLLANGVAVLRAADAGEAPLNGEIILPRIQSRAEFALSYPVPADGVESLSLHYYHDEYAPVTIALLGEAADTTAQAPMQPIQANALMEIGVFGVETAREWNGQAAPDGMTWLAVDLRGRGLWSIEADALALDRAADPEERVRLPKVMEYVQAAGLLQVVVDGEYAFVRDPDLGALSANPAFLPDAMAGGVGVFPIPEGVESVVLEVHFPEFRGPGIDDPIPESMMFTLRGAYVASDAATPAGLIEDVPTPFTLHGLERTDAFGDHAAGANERLLVLDASMRNESPVGGMMGISSRVDLITDDGEPAEFVGIFNAGPIPLAEPFWLPTGGDARRFQLVYRASEDFVPTALDYRGVSVNTELPLSSAALE